MGESEILEPLTVHKALWGWMYGEVVQKPARHIGPYKEGEKQTKHYPFEPQVHREPSIATVRFFSLQLNTQTSRLGSQFLVKASHHLSRDPRFC